MSVLGGISAGVNIAEGLWNVGSGIWQNVQNQKNQQTAWAREDNAVQRRAADMEAAGLSKTLAAGNAAQSSAPIRMEAPRLQLNPVEKYQQANLNDMAMKSAEQQLLQGQANIDKTNAQKDYINQQRLRAEQDINYRNELNPLKIAELQVKNEFNNQTYNDRVRSLEQRVEKTELEKLNVQADTELEKMGVTRMVVQNVVDAARAALYGVEVTGRERENIRKRENEYEEDRKRKLQGDYWAADLEAKRLLLDKLKKQGYDWKGLGKGIDDALEWFF